MPTETALADLKERLAAAQQERDDFKAAIAHYEAAVEGERQAHHTTKQELAQQRTIAQGLERTANGFQQQFASLDRQHQALHADLAAQTQELARAQADRDDFKRKYHEMYDARAKVAALLSDLRHDTADHEALKRTIRVVYAVVKVALDDLTAADGEDDANPDAAAPALLDALALLDASGAFARQDR